MLDLPDEFDNLIEDMGDADLACIIEMNERELNEDFLFVKASILKSDCSI